MEKIYDYTIRLLRYVLKGDVPDLPNDIDFEKLYEFSLKHGIEVMIFTALTHLNVKLPFNIYERFRAKCSFAVMRDTKQIYEFGLICRKFEDAHIDYMPLKGIVIRNLYSESSFRKSGDIDILVKPNDISKAESILLVNGYTYDNSKECELHKQYLKMPFIAIEIHDRLVEK